MHQYKNIDVFSFKCRYIFLTTGLCFRMSNVKDMVERVFGPVSSLDSEGVAGSCNLQPGGDPAAVRAGSGDPAAAARPPGCGPTAATRLRAVSGDHPAVGRQPERRPDCGPAVATRRRPDCPAAATNRQRAGSGDPAAGRRRRPSATRLRADWLLRVRATRSAGRRAARPGPRDRHR
jgi:hypothetical protein